MVTSAREYKEADRVPFDLGRAAVTSININSLRNLRGADTCPPRSIPGRLEPGKVDAITHVVDWMPTLTRLAGYQPESNLKWDGMDIWPWITGKETQTLPRTIYWKFIGGQMAVRHGDWKLIVPRNELFNLVDDPCEKHNLAKSEPARVADLLERLAQARKLDVARRPSDPTTQESQP